MTKAAATLVRLKPAPRRQPVPPRKLGAHGMKLWKSIVSEYVFSDPGSLEMLCQACQALDRAEVLAAEIARDGPIYQTPRGPAGHPGLKVELGNRAFVTATLTKLGLDLEPLRPGPGRPPGA
jgi:hypothetical protein